MEPDDGLGDDEPRSPLLPPDDRLWRHPSEVAAHGLPWEEPPPPRGPPPVWAVAGLAALVGALLTMGVVAATGGLRDRVRTVPAVGALVPVWMGVEGADLDAAAADRLGLAGAAVVTGVRSSSPAGRAGLAPADVITSVDGVPVASMSALRLLLRSHRPGHVVALALVRDGRARTVKVTLAERPQA